jgi:hypothetical protein
MLKWTVKLGDSSDFQKKHETISEGSLEQFASDLLRMLERFDGGVSTFHYQGFVEAVGRWDKRKREVKTT